MKRSLVCMFFLAALSFSALAQTPQAGSPQVDQRGAGKDKTRINAADRAEMAKGASQVKRGMQGFFQALDDALAQAHRNRADAEKATAVKTSAAGAKRIESKDTASTAARPR